MTVDWPALGQEQRPWDSPWSTSTGLAEALDVAVVPPIAGLHVPLGEAAPVLRAARDAVQMLDERTTVDVTTLAGALLRSESVASSKIEHLAATQRELGLAMLRGVPVQTAAAHVAANVRAMSAAVATPPARTPYHVADLLHVHRLLMEADPYEGGWAGRLRTMQNWVGGGDLSPHGALYVPPAPERVAGLVTDLVTFCNRTDVDPIAQAAVAHAQFETIHPFTDGNGRTGRALVHVLLRRRELARRTVVPVSTVLLADVDGYFVGLDDYRAGRLEAWLIRFAAATTRAATAGLRLAGDVAALRTQWQEAVHPRSGSASARLLDALLRQPVVDIDSLRELTRPSGERPEQPARAVADKNIYAAVDRLTAAGVLTELSGAGRNRVWAAQGVLDLLERVETQLGQRTERLSAR